MTESLGASASTCCRRCNDLSGANRDKGVKLGATGEPGDAVEPADAVEEETWTTGQVAEFLKPWGFSRKLISEMVNTGELPATRRHPGAWARVPARVVRAYAKALGTPTGTVQRRAGARIGRPHSP